MKTQVIPIIAVPHPVLRKVAKPIGEISDEVIDFITNLEETLVSHRKPRGVGLSAPQVDHSLKIYSTFLPPQDDEAAPAIIRTFINPEIVKTSADKTIGEDLSQPILEGCLSIPHLYGPVPRFTWIELEYQVIEKNKLITKKEKFADFAARVVQHEQDHLIGKLFTDYILQFDLPLYDDTSGKLKETDRNVAEKF